MKKQLASVFAVMIAVTAFSVNQPAQAFKLWPHKKAPAKVEAPAAVAPAVVTPAPVVVTPAAPAKKECKPCEVKKQAPAKAPAAKKPCPAHKPCPMAKKPIKK